MAKARGKYRKRRESEQAKVEAAIAASPHADDLRVIADKLYREEAKYDRIFGSAGRGRCVTVDDLPHVAIRYVDGMGPFGNYVVSINHGVMRYGLDGFGWCCWTEGNARRKGERELAKYIRREARQIRENERLK